MDTQLQQLVERINQAQNVLVAVSANPSVDQLSAAIGLTLVLNKLNKHGTAVFSGQVPSTLEFLKPEDTLEKNTDSLRDFIIALDKSKADKLRYKVEDDVVRIFITPYKTSISDKDLQFSQGDFNVDVVVALGVMQQQDLDSAITAHGRILHDATVASVNTVGQGDLGTINWLDANASSLSEMVVGLSDALDKTAIDAQIATALLTGIVATTERFRNDKTTPKTMSASAELMAAGANQQLIATELESALEVQQPVPEADAPAEKSAKPTVAVKKAEPGTLEIEHESAPDLELPEETPKPVQPQVNVDENGQLSTIGATPAPEPPASQVTRERMLEPPSMKSDLTANASPEIFDPPTEALTLPRVDTPLLTHDQPAAPQNAPAPFVPAPAAPFTPPSAGPADLFGPDETLAEIEQSVDSPHLHSGDAAAAPGHVDDARSAVEAALSGASSTNALPPIDALNAQPLGAQLHEQPLPPANPMAPMPNAGFSESTPGNSPADQSLDMTLPTNPFPAAAPAPADLFNPAAPQQPFAPPSAFPGAQPAPGSVGGQTPPPPVPPPMLPPLQ